MHVAYVLRAFPRLSETFLLNEILALRATGVAVSVFALERIDEPRMHPAARAMLPEVTFVDFAALGTIEPAAVPAKHRAAAQAGWVIGDLLRGTGVTHLHAHFAGPAATAACFAAQVCGAQFSFTAHAKDIFADSVDWEWLARLGHRAAAVITVCDYSARFLRRRLIGARVRRIHNGVDLALWQPGSGAVVQGPVVAVGRFVRKKGFHVLVDALARLRDQGRPTRAVLIGEGKERANVMQQVRELGLTRWVRFPGALTQPEVRRQLRRAGIVTLPCVVDTDGNQDALPTVLIEAAASGVPTVATRIAGVPEIIQHGRTGLVIEPGDAIALARALDSLLRAPARRARFGRAARAHAVSRFDQNAAIRRLIRIFSASSSMIATTTEETPHAHRPALS